MHHGRFIIKHYNNALNVLSEEIFFFLITFMKVKMSVSDYNLDLLSMINLFFNDSGDEKMTDEFLG